jgi:hypothetical protein
VHRIVRAGVPGGARRSIRGVAAANTLGGHGPQRHGHHRPASRLAGWPAHPPGRRQRDRCSGGHRGGAQRRLPGEHRHRRRSVRADLRGQREKGLSAERQRHRAERADARAHELARLQSEPGQLRPGIGHAIRRDPHRDGARIALGLGRSADALRDENVQGRAAAGDRLRRSGLPDHRGDCERLAHEERAPVVRLLQGTGSRFGEDLLHRRQPADHRDDLPQPRSGQDVPADSAARARRVLSRRGREGRSAGR